jgi:serine/threonine-protein kinase HipA
VSVGNDWGLLVALGRDCAGALRLCPPGEEEAEGSVSPLGDAEVASLAREGGGLARAFEEHGARLSLAGAQDKLPVVLMDDGALGLPQGRQASTHLLKFPNPSWPGLPEVEWLTLRVARNLGLEVVDAELRSVEDVSVLLVERYDRWRDDAGLVHRLHQEDGCQALGFGPERKYESDGGPALADCFRLVDEHSDAITRDLPELLRRTVANVLLGNSDAHAKNLSLLRGRDGRLRLAPAYDLVCTLAWPGIASRLAQSVGGQSDPGQLGRNRWRKLAEELGFGARWALSEVEAGCSAFGEALAGALGAAPPEVREHDRVVEAERRMRERHRRLERLLAD